MKSTVVKIESDFVVVAGVVVVVVVVVETIGSVTSVVALVLFVMIGASVLNDVWGRSVVVVSKGYTVMEKSSMLVKCMFNTYASTPRAKIVARMRRIERNLGSTFFGFTSATCLSLNSFTG